MLLIGRATHQEETTFYGMILRKGQYVRSYEKLREDLIYKVGVGNQEYSKHTIHKCVQKLIQAERISVKETEFGTLFTVLNYEKYQEPQTSAKKFAQNRVNGGETDPEPRGKYIKKAIKANKAKGQKSRRKQVFDNSSVPYRLAVYFYEQIKLNNPEHREPNLQSWADEVRKMLELDQRTEEQVKYLMRWVQQDDFEMMNVLSPAKLRKRFDALVMKVKQENRKGMPVRKESAGQYDYTF